MPATRETLTSLAVPSERTRYYSKLRTMRMSQRAVELVPDDAELRFEDVSGIHRSPFFRDKYTCR